mgnify:FL=1
MKKHQQKQKGQGGGTPLFIMAELDLVLKIDFKDEDLEVANENGEEGEKFNKLDLDELTEIKSLKFLQKNDKIIDRFQVKPKNEMLKQLIIGNMNSSQKTPIDYICFGRPTFQDEEEFFNDVLDSILKKTGITLNKFPLDINGQYSIKIEMSHKGKKKEISLGGLEADTHEDDNEIKGEGETKANQEEQQDQEGEEEDEDYEENEAMKKKLIPKFKRKKSVLCNLYPSYDKYGMIYINFSELDKIPGNFKLDDLLELLCFFKKKNTTIFINYYKNEKPEEKDDKNGKNDKNKNKKDKNKKVNESSNNENSDNENSGDEQSKENQGEDGEKKENKGKDKDKDKDEEPSEEMKQLNKFYYMTDIYFFDKGQAINDFNEHYKAFTKDKNKKKIKINSKNVYDYFSKGIATGTEETVPADKTGLFLDEFKKFIIIHKSKNSLSKQEYDCQPFPKVNPHNLKEVSDYKDILKENKNEYYPLFLANFITSMGSSAPKCTKAEVLYPAFLNGMDIIKKNVEYKKNCIEIPTDDMSFYKIKRHPKALAAELERIAKDEQEGKFMLDCTNLITSNKKEYVSLYDYHLKNFFSSQIIRNDLKNKGFIDDKGYIMYDPVYRSVMGANCKNKKTLTEQEKKNKIISTIKDIKVTSRLKDKEIDTENAANNENSATLKKIPYVKEKPKKKKKTRPDGSSSKGGSNDSNISSSEEGKSGDESGNNEEVKE